MAITHLAEFKNLEDNLEKCSTYHLKTLEEILEANPTDLENIFGSNFVKLS